MVAPSEFSDTIMSIFKISGFTFIDKRYFLITFWTSATFLPGGGVEGGTVMPWGPQGVLGAQSVLRKEPGCKRAPAPGA